MCEICRSSVCVAGCPNKEDKSVYVCSHCTEDILEGEQYIEVSDEKVCLNCLEQESVTELLNILGFSVEIATREDKYFE